jgi:uracil-DNA glycosylase
LRRSTRSYRSSTRRNRNKLHADALIDFDGGVRPPVTVHPSYLLRLPDAGAKTREYARFVDDLKIAAKLLKKHANAA